MEVKIRLRVIIEKICTMDAITSEFYRIFIESAESKKTWRKRDCDLVKG